MPENLVDPDYTQFGTLKVRERKPLAPVLDLLIAGGGPAGTAAAMRAAELGLSALVIDYDDLMKRIRDYPKEKLIRPNYGGGDKLQFPPGGPLVTSLYFDDVDKDQMVRVWKDKYKENNVAAKIGSEFTGLVRDDGVWAVKTWNYRARQEFTYKAKNVLIAIGAGVPRRFDIPGNTDGLAFRLDDPKRYVGGPVLVIGGGTSAGEAVIAISNAKVDAEDESPVYWSYRGDSMPKVSKALSDMFFAAYVGNGNIRYLSFSEPTAIVLAPDKQEYLSLRIDRKVVEGRPPETVHLEFAKHRVVACIGEDLPVKLLQSLGVKIPLVNNRPLMLVNREGEVSQPGVFLVGDARGPKYLRCTDFNDSTSYEQIVQKRNIKAAMVEAVQAVEVIAARMGVVSATMSAPPEMPVRPESAAGAQGVVPPAPLEPEAARPLEHVTQLVAVHPDGTVDEQFPIGKDLVTIGRSSADIQCADDVYMADQHATITRSGDAYFLADSGTGSGVWIRAQGVEGRRLEEGGLVWVGSQILMATRSGSGWAIAQYNSEGVYQAAHAIDPARGLFVGRATQVALDPSDLSLSRRHAQFRISADGLYVFDLGSKNGTYAKLTAPFALANGDEFRVGSRRFRFETFTSGAKLAPTDVVTEQPIEPDVSPAATPAAAPEGARAAAPAAAVSASPAPARAAKAASAAAAAAPAAAVAAGLAAATIEHPEFSAVFGVAPGQDLLHAYFGNLKTRFPDCKVSSKGDPTEHMDEPVGWECKVGLCGLCAVQILDGADNFLPVDPGSPEMNTVANKAFLDADPKKYRLACLAKIKGPVKLGMPS